MADPCVVKSGEVVTIDDPRLSDTGCTVEAGVVIRPPTDETTVQAVEKPAPVKRVEKPAKRVEKVEVIQPETPPPPDMPPVPMPVAAPVTTAQIVVPPPQPKDNSVLGMTPEAAMVAGAVTVAAVGGAVATSAMGGVSAVQAKVASLFGSKATVAVASGAAVTAGMIVAVKALESKMGKLEKDMDKAKEEVGGAASSIDRIDQLLSRLGSDHDDKLDPSV